jgi:dUTP pyrophosphatase
MEKNLFDDQNDQGSLNDLMKLISEMEQSGNMGSFMEPEKLEFNYEKLDDDVDDPNYAYESDSGFDLKANEDVEIMPYSRVGVKTGLKFSIPEGLEMQVRPKSGLALHKGLTVLNTPGTVDSGYLGEVVVIMFNTTKETVRIDRGMKIAQAVLCPVVNGKFVNFVQVESVADASGNKDRNENGFGSTGV